MYEGYKTIKVSLSPELWEFLTDTQGDKSVAFRINQILKEAHKQHKETKKEVTHDTRSIL